MAEANVASTEPKEKAAPPKGGPPPRLHNMASYFVTLVVFGTVVFWRAGGSLDGAFMLPFALWSFHFARRTSESAFLHRYGKPSIPIADAVTEYVYYWGFAVWIAWSVTRPSYQVASGIVPTIGLVVFAIGESGNFITHVMLARLRPRGSKERKIPHGFLFEIVSCPNYMFEIITWIGFAMVSGALGAIVFAALGAVILADWARKRHAAYVKEFDGKDGRAAYPGSRKRLLPFIF